MWSHDKSFVPPPPSTAYNQPPPPPSHSNGHSKDKKRYDPLEDDEDEFVPLPPRPPQPQSHHPQQPQHPQQGSGIDFSKYDDIPVECSGRSPVAPIMSWRDIDLPSTIQKNIDDAKYTKPTPVQRYSLPIVMNGRDLMSCAQTGSGKTAAFLLPVLVNLTKMREYGSNNGGYGRKATPYVLVLAPTRELAIQIFDECKKFSNGTRIRACILYGGAPMGGQLRELERGCDVIIATPGRLTDVMDRGKVSLANIKYLILDEADRMLDMGFEPQIRRIVQKEDMPTTGKRQTLMFSATFPKEIQQLASQFLHDYLFLTIGRVGSTTELVSQKFVKVFDESDKQQKLLQLVSTVPGLTLIFVETKKKANNLDYYLKRNGYPSSSIHGDREQAEREAALKSFSSGRTPYLIATNVAARGLDISNVVHVINYDMAPNIDDYVHRIGRTGRAGKAGVSTTFITTDNANVVSDLLKLLRDAKQEVPSWLEEMKYMRKSSGGYKGGSGGRFGGGSSFGGGGKRFGAKDFRQDFHSNKDARSSSSSSNNYPAPAYGGTPFGGYPPFGFQQPPFQSAPASANFPVPPFDPALVASYYGYPNPNNTFQPPANNSTNTASSDQNGSRNDDRSSSKKRYHEDSRDSNRDRDSHRDSRRDKDSHRDREHRDRDSHSSRDRDRDGHRDRDSHRDKERDSHRDRDSHSSRDRGDRDDRERKHRKTDDEYKSRDRSERSHY